MAFQEKLLGQARPSSTTATSLYSPAANISTIIRTIFVCNVTISVVKFRIFVHDSGSVFDEDTALFWDVTLAGNTTIELNTVICMNDANGNLGVKTNIANALTFTAFGSER